jgi:hypothetical protein
VKKNKEGRNWLLDVLIDRHIDGEKLHCVSAHEVHVLPESKLAISWAVYLKNLTFRLKLRAYPTAFHAQYKSWWSLSFSQIIPHRKNIAKKSGKDRGVCGQGLRRNRAKIRLRLRKNWNKSSEKRPKSNRRDKYYKSRTRNEERLRGDRKKKIWEKIEELGRDQRDWDQRPRRDRTKPRERPRRSRQDEAESGRNRQKIEKKPRLRSSDREETVKRSKKNRD